MCPLRNFPFYIWKTDQCFSIMKHLTQKIKQTKDALVAASKLEFRYEQLRIISTFSLTLIKNVFMEEQNDGLKSVTTKWTQYI